MAGRTAGPLPARLHSHLAHRGRGSDLSRMRGGAKGDARRALLLATDHVPAAVRTSALSLEDATRLASSLILTATATATATAKRVARPALSSDRLLGLGRGRCGFRRHRVRSLGLALA